MQRYRLLVVDDSLTSRDIWRRVFSAEGYDVTTATGLEQALTHLRQAPVDVVVSDVRMDCGIEGIDLLRAVKQEHKSIPVILYTSFGLAEEEALALEFGADDYLSLPESPVLINAVRTSLEGLRTDVAGPAEARLGTGKRVVAASAAMKVVTRMVNRIAPTDFHVLITGETGTGKELVARAIHAGSLRAQHPFVAVNCGAIPPGFAEAEFFGYRKGSFTGAMADRQGLVLEADRGTLFLDEVGELPAMMQVFLLRFLDTGEFRRLGDNKLLSADVRVIAATNRRLAEDMAAGRFRTDLYYRLQGWICHLPPLRERLEDTEQLVQQWCDRKGGTRIRVKPEAMARLLAYQWPGNVRELFSVLTRVSLLACSGTIDERGVDFVLDQEPSSDAMPARSDGHGDEERRTTLRHSLEKHHWHLGRTAASLGISRWTLRRRLQNLDLDR